MGTEKIYPEGLLGKKLGMTSGYNENGDLIPLTAIQVGPCFVLAVFEKDKDGYDGVQVGFGPKKPQRVNKPAQGHFNKASQGAFYHVKEIRCDVASLGWNEVGKELSVEDILAAGEKVDITGTSIGKGFQGVVRKYGMRGQPATRGTHEYRRNVGSVGCRKSPGRIFKNKRMPGQMGNKKVTVQNLKVFKVDTEDNVVFVAGAVPGPKGGIVTLNRAIKGYKPLERSAAAEEKAA